MPLLRLKTHAGLDTPFIDEASARQLREVG